MNGAPGAQGPQGIQGTPGVGGAAGEASLQYFYRETLANVVLPPGQILTVYAGAEKLGVPVGGGCTQYEPGAGHQILTLLSSMPVLYYNAIDNPYNGLDYVAKNVFGLMADTEGWYGWKCEFKNLTSLAQPARVKAFGLLLNGANSIDVRTSRAEELADTAARAAAGSQ